MRIGWLVALAACGKHQEAGPHGAALDQQVARDLFEVVPLDVPPGISDLTVDDRGVMWAIAERDREVLEIELADPPRVTLHPLDGVPAKVDTEGLAWLGDDHFAIGAEGADTPTAAILFAELAGEHLVVTRTRPLTNAELGVSLTINHGIEALCGRPGELLAASETVGRLPDGTRYAPLVRLRDDTPSVTKVRLTTDRGKLSALSCRFAPDGSADVIAIERHYGVCRLLHFTTGPTDVDVTPTVELDLFPVLRDSLNLEGIVRLPDGRLVAINDNQSKGTHGPTELLVFRKR